jgi:ABC-2 type transport system permease protein
MKSITIAWKDTLLRLRDPIALLISFVSPLAVMVMVGSIFGNNQPSAVPVMVLNQDVGSGSGSVGRTFQEAFLAAQHAGTVRLITPDATKPAEPAQLRQLLQEGVASVAVIVPVGFTQSVLDGAPKPIDLLCNSPRDVGCRVVQTIVDQTGFRVGLRTVAHAYNLPDSQLAALVSPDVFQTGPYQAASFLPGIMVLFLLFNAVKSGSSLLEERDSGTLQRLFVAPISRRTVVTGKLLGSFIHTGLQASVLVLGLRLLFDFQLGNPLFVIGLLVSVILAGIGLGIVMGGLMKSPRIVDGASSAVILLMALIGGTFVPTRDSVVLRSLSLLTPNHWATTGLLESASGTGGYGVALSIAVLLMMTVLYVALGSRLLAKNMSPDSI